MKVGEVLGGRYELLKQIGRGGSGTVYLAMDMNLRKNWALKALEKTGTAKDDVTKAVLMSELDMLKKLSHPNLPRIVDAFENEEAFFVVMDFIEGKTLSRLLMEEGAQNEEDVLRWALTIAEVLRYLHSRHPPVIYRDMKPANIMLKPSGEVVLFDFGIARERKNGSGQDTLLLCTPGYAAPEQLGGAQTDERTDIYGFGATIYHLLTGQDPGKPPYLIRPLRQLNASFSKGFEIIIGQCTEKDPAKRYQNCTQLLRDLRHVREMDDVFLRKEKRKLMAFSVALSVGIAGLVFAAAGRNGIRNEQNARYIRLLSEADQLALREGETFSEEVVTAYTEAGDALPEREEAWLRILDYCAEMGCPKKGLQTVCARVDIGQGGIDTLPAVLFRIGELYFEGTGGERAASGDYRRAARYFAMIDHRVMPESVYYASLAEAMSAQGGKTDWSYIAGMLRHFESYNAGLGISLWRIRNTMAAAGVYASNRRAMSESGIDAWGEAIRLLKQAEADASTLLTEAESGVPAEYTYEEVAEKERRILRRLGALCAAAYAAGHTAGSWEDAAAFYEKLLRYTEDADEIREIRFRIADAVQTGGDEGQILAARKKLTEDYPDDAEGWLAYASCLAEQGRSGEALACYQKALGCPDADKAPSLRSVGLSLAGQLNRAQALPAANEAKS